MSFGIPKVIRVRAEFAFFFCHGTPSYKIRQK